MKLSTRRMHSSRMHTTRTLPYGGHLDRGSPGQRASRQRAAWTETSLVRQLPNWDYLTIFFAENCMKMKEFGPRGRMSLVPPLDLPMPLDRDPLDIDPRHRNPGQRPPRQRPPGQRSPGQRPLDRDPPDRGPLDTLPWTESPPLDRDPWTETPWTGRRPPGQM